MAITDGENGNGFYMPVAPAYGGGYGNNNGFGGGDGWWVLLLLLAMNGGWGFGGMGGWGGMMGMGMMDGMWTFPWLLNGQNGINNNVSDGFRDAQLHDSVTSVRDGINSLATQLCNCCNDMQMTVNGAQSAISNQLYSNEIASLNRSFAEQTANMQGFNGVQSSLCDIRYGNASNTRDIIESQTRGTQAVLDKLCQLELDGYKREADQLRAENSVLKNQGFIANEINQQNEVFYNRLKNCPVNAVPVAGNTPLFSCNPSFNTPGCGCGNNGFGFNG